ncbi:MAG: hypothetical protein IPM12_15825 [Flavobacteriales bacterium]|nr:hypothetical protein [Flavobacteriales bacterium]
MRPLSILFLLTLASCAGTQYIEKGTHDGVEIAYRWSHPPGKPSELLLRLKNVSGADKRVSLGIDLYYQGRTVEAFEADTCLRPGMLLAGRLNGIYFIPRALTTGQIKDGGAAIEATRTVISDESCP